jgi:hypothetical protein
MPSLVEKHMRLALLLSALSIAIVVPIIWKFYWPAADGLDIVSYPYGRDFINNWAGPRLVFSGRVLQLFDLHAYTQLVSLEFGRALRKTLQGCRSQ